MVLNLVLIPNSGSTYNKKLILLVSRISSKVLYASSHGQFIAANEFRCQCRIFRFGNRKYLSVVIIAFQKMQSLRSLLLRRVQHNYNNYYNGALVARGGRKSSIPAMNLDTLRGRRKGDPQHKCCGEKTSNSILTRASLHIFPTTFMLRVSFSPAPQYHSLHSSFDTAF